MPSYSLKLHKSFKLKYSPSQVLTAKHVSYPQLTATVVCFFIWIVAIKHLLQVSFRTTFSCEVQASCIMPTPCMNKPVKQPLSPDNLTHYDIYFPSKIPYCGTATQLTNRDLVISSEHGIYTTWSRIHFENTPRRTLYSYHSYLWGVSLVGP